MRNDGYKRAHETSEHVCVKQALARLLRHCGWIVMVESLCVDLAAISPIFGDLWVLEVERSDKHIQDNVLKAFIRGASRLLIVASNQSVAVTANKVVTTMPDHLRIKTLVVTTDEVDENFVHTVMENVTRNTKGEIQ